MKILSSTFREWIQFPQELFAQRSKVQSLWVPENGASLRGERNRLYQYNGFWRGLRVDVAIREHFQRSVPFIKRCARSWSQVAYLIHNARFTFSMVRDFNCETSNGSEISWANPQRSVPWSLNLQIKHSSTEAGNVVYHTLRKRCFVSVANIFLGSFGWTGSHVQGRCSLSSSRADSANWRRADRRGEGTMLTLSSILSQAKLWWLLVDG